jgi:hypothetical protein
MMAAMGNDALILDDLQRDILAPQVEVFLAASPDTAARAPYLALRDAIDSLLVPAALSGPFESIIELMLTSGRARASYGPGGERSLWTLFQKTPRGRYLIDSVTAANTALQQLIGAALEFVNVAARAPGAYAITLKTAEFQLVLRFDATGARVESVEVGGE